jgi:hypothetical protein
MDLSAIALQGIQQASSQLEGAATQIASFGSQSPDGATLDVVDLSAEIIALISAKNLAAVNIDTLKVSGEVQKSLLNVLA